MTTHEQLTQFGAMLEEAQKRGYERFIGAGFNPALRDEACKVEVRSGVKYAKVDIGSSGRFMVVIDTGEIFGIKGYGVINKRKPYGTLATTGEWDWSGYSPARVQPAA